MKFEPTVIEGVFLVDLTPHVDERGFFARAWCRREFAEVGADTEMVQTNLAYTKVRGTLRGLHFQAPPHAEVKFVRCVRGAAFVVAADLREASSTYLRWIGAELNAENRRGLLVPRGCAQGYQTLVDDVEMLYQMSDYFVPEAGRGVRWDDPALGIDWPLSIATISPRDLAWPLLESHAAP